MNKVILMGNLARDIELRQGNTTTGKTAIAVKRIKDGTDFINIVAFGVTAETMAKYLSKGSQVLIEGRIQTGSYTNKDGIKVNTTDVIVERFEFCGSAKGTSVKPKDDEFMVVDVDDPNGVPFV